jgi:hypothetical protein
VARNTTRQGANFELAVMRDLEKHEYTCLRSSGSLGAVDVVGVGKAAAFSDHAWIRSPLLFVQCKITNPVIPPAERMALQDLALRAGAVPLVAFRAKHETTGRIGIKYRQLTGPGPKDWAPWAPGEDD